MLLFLSTLSLRRATDLEPSSTRRLTFLSTLSLRRATLIEFRKLLHPSYFYPRSPCGERRRRPIFFERAGYFYPRSPCGERRANSRTEQQGQHISIHALLAESDARNTSIAGRITSFLSTLSLRRATAKVHKTVGHFCAYETNFMGIASSC